MRTAALVLAALVTVAACSPTTWDGPRTPSFALDPAQTTRLTEAVARLNQPADGRSSVYLLSDGIDALSARLLLAEETERTIDAQYYLLHNDVAGHLFVWQLLRAADRGVRVRLLLDDLDTLSYDRATAALDSHPNVEVRLFNPVDRGRGVLLSGLREFGRINRRMHNKSMTFDNVATIVGGRNIGAEYFSAREDTNYDDLDILAMGPVAREVSEAFDLYWNSPQSVPADQVLEKTEARTLDELRAWLEGRIAEARLTPYGAALESELVEEALSGRVAFQKVPATVYADAPDKAEGSAAARASDTLTDQIAPLVNGAERELIVSSAYFVPRKAGSEWLGDMVGRGVEVLILTNSLSSNDVLPVHGHYSRYRKRLLRSGVDLWELRRARPEDSRTGRDLDATDASLHTKAFVVDRRYIFIGSFNWDPRSVRLNTEMGILIESPEIAEAVADYLLASLPERAYELRLDQDDDLLWVSRQNGVEVVTDQEPDAGWRRALMADIYRILPIGSLL